MLLTNSYCARMLCLNHNFIVRMPKVETAERILDAAEELFAEHGFSETSLRNITSKADVNLAAVNYHFGSKKALIQALFKRFLDPFTTRLDKALDEEIAKTQSNALTVEQLLSILTTTFVITAKDSKSSSLFMRLLGLAYTQSQGHLRKYLREEYKETYKRFLHLVMEATPELSNMDRFWRIHFMLGATVFTLSGIDALRAMAEDDYHVHIRTQEVVERLMPFLAAGLTSAKSYPPADSAPSMEQNKVST